MAKRETVSDAVLARREYQKAWRAKNKDKVAEAQQRYWQKKAAQAKEA